VEVDLAVVDLEAGTSVVFVADSVSFWFWLPRSGVISMRWILQDAKFISRHIAQVAAALLLITSLVSCGKSQNPALNNARQRTFASPEDAGAALLEVAKTGDSNALVAIFGPDSKNLVSSGDPVKDKDALQDFVAAYTQMHRWREIKSGGEMLYIGADNFIFPVPLGRNSSGQWSFDTAAGKDEILARRIGKDELTAIAACLAIVDAQNQYFSQVREGYKVKQYAQKFVSDSGQQNGLYWPVSAGQSPSPFEDVRDFAKAVGYTNSADKPQPFDGYYFRILTKQSDRAKGGAKDYLVNGIMAGGFAVIAYPVQYRNSGIMTFIVDKDGVVYQKDLGEQTTAVAEAMTTYDPSDGWNPATNI
jgi:hypothetical protein